MTQYQDTMRKLNQLIRQRIKEELERHKIDLTDDVRGTLPAKRLGSSSAGSGLSKPSGGALTVSTDDITIELNGSGQVAIKDDGVGPAQLEDTAVVAGEYTNPVITVDAQGRITGVTVTSGYLVDPTTTLGDILVRMSGGINRLAVGADGQFLSVVSGEPAWADIDLSTKADTTDARFPTTDEKAALNGTGTPSASNKYVTNDDSRMTDSRAPNGAAGGDLAGTYPNPTLAPSGVTAGIYTYPEVTVDAKGRITNIATRAVGIDIEASSGSPALSEVSVIEIGARLTLVNEGGGRARIDADEQGGTGVALTVEEADGNPSVADVAKIIVGNGDLTDSGGGTVRIKTAADATGGGSGGGGGVGDTLYLYHNCI